MLSVFVLSLGMFVEAQPGLTFLCSNATVFTLYTVLQNIRYGTIKTIVDFTIVTNSALPVPSTDGRSFGKR